MKCTTITLGYGGEATQAQCAFHHALPYTGFDLGVFCVGAVVAIVLSAVLLHATREKK